jgi:hypothetical protein
MCSVVCVAVASSFDLLASVQIWYGVAGKPQQMQVSIAESTVECLTTLTSLVVSVFQCSRLTRTVLDADTSRVRCTVNRGLGAGLQFSLWCAIGSRSCADALVADAASGIVDARRLYQNSTLGWQQLSLHTAQTLSYPTPTLTSHSLRRFYEDPSSVSEFTMPFPFPGFRLCTTKFNAAILQPP